MHILRIEFDGGRKQIEVLIHGAKQMPGIAGVVGAKPGILIGKASGAGRKLSVWLMSGRAAGIKTSFHQVIGRFLIKTQRRHNGRQVVRIATDDLQKAVLAGHQSAIVDIACIHLASQTRCPGH